VPQLLILLLFSPFGLTIESIKEFGVASLSPITVHHGVTKIKKQIALHIPMSLPSKQLLSCYHKDTEYSQVHIKGLFKGKFYIGK
jgi:hypothetical protein